MKKYVRIILTCIGIAAVLYFVIWIWFLLIGPVPSGPELEKKDWLQFFGSFLGFFGTTFLGPLTIWQSREIENKTNLLDCKSNIFPSINNNITLTYGEKMVDFNHYFEDSNVITFLREKDAHKGLTVNLLLPFTYSGRAPDSISVTNFVITCYGDGVHSYEYFPETEKFVSCTSVGSNIFSLYLIIGENEENIKRLKYEIEKNLYGSVSFDLKMKIKINNVVTEITCALFVQQKNLDTIISQGAVYTQSVYIDKSR